MIHFRLDQRVRIVRSDQKGVVRRVGTVRKVSPTDDSATIVLDGKTEPKEVVAWPDDCEPV